MQLKDESVLKSHYFCLLVLLGLKAAVLFKLYMPYNSTFSIST